MSAIRAFLFLSLLALGGTLNAAPWPVCPLKLVGFAREQVGVTVGYDPAYRALAYPDGDVPLSTGVCTDVLIRALRGHSIDLQKEVHQDMKAHFSKYPQKWGLRGPDKNIDHRRVPNLAAYFTRRGGCVQPVTDRPEDYLPGDVVTWLLDGKLPHIGLVSDRKTASGIPLILHNIGRGTQEEDVLFAFPITGHFRIARLP